VASTDAAPSAGAVSAAVDVDAGALGAAFFAAVVFDVADFVVFAPVDFTVVDFAAVVFAAVVLAPVVFAAVVFAAVVFAAGVFGVPSSFTARARGARGAAGFLAGAMPELSAAGSTDSGLSPSEGPWGSECGGTEVTPLTYQGHCGLAGRKAPHRGPENRCPHPRAGHEKDTPIRFSFPK
jgi:hypothetical protein